jgi:hypothetical protein
MGYTTIEDCAIAWRTKPLVSGEIGWCQCACDRAAGQVANMASIKEMRFLRFKVDFILEIENDNQTN